MSDPFLNAHNISPRQYTLGGKLFPVSIRDQFLRGEQLIHRLAEAKQIGKDLDPVLVIGAGAAGIAAAVCAACRYNCVVYLVERNAYPFMLQELCHKRRVDPTLYDYPALHWRNDTYPFEARGPDVGRIDWSADLAYLLVPHWRGKFKHASEQPGVQLHFVAAAEVGTLVPDATQTPRYIEAPIEYTDPSGTHPKSPIKASVVIHATGFGPERRYLRPAKKPGKAAQPAHPAWGFKFWSDDPYDDPDCGVPNPKANPPQVVISGSGDGALQDFLRVITVHPHTRSLCDELFGPLGLQLPDDAIHRLYDGADRLGRDYTWGTNAAHDHTPLARLHQTMQSIVDQLWNADPIAFKRIVGGTLKPRLPKLKLIHSCNHFSNGYPLNRLLVLIIKKHLDAEYGPDEFFLPGSKVVDIRPSPGTNHACASNERDCHGQLHDVYWAPCPDCGQPAGARDPGNMIQANVLVLRHGVDDAEQPDQPAPVPSRHILPYGPS